MDTRRCPYSRRTVELTVAQGMHNSTELVPASFERGIQLSRSQVYVVHRWPECVSLQLMAALRDIPGCGVENLVTVTVNDARKGTTAEATRTA